MIRSILLVLSLVTICQSQENEGFETDYSCDVCHVGGDWSADAGDSFDHIVTGYELKGIHADVDCGSCHIGSTPAEKHNFGDIATDCIGCHDDIHNDQWGQDCERCHTPVTWELSTQQQNHDLTNFPLQGPHKSLSCESCHLNNPGEGTTLSLDCSGCHSETYDLTENPSHQLLELGNDCEACHSATSTQWSSSIFDHSATGYNLIGMHHTVDCANCHQQDVKNTPSECVDCHISDFEASMNPPHRSEGYPLDCQSCHDSFTWNSPFVHEETGFLLEGAHELTLCSGCHIDQVFTNTPITCEGCHETDWASTVEPPHDDAEFDMECQECHGVVSWKPSLWHHDSDTDYPLTGVHITASCVDCHLSDPYSEQATECFECHESDYNESREPDHVSGNFPLTCEVCHTTSDWESDEIDHDQTAFPLVGAHREVECTTCHESGYDLPISCEGCHLEDYTSTTSTSSPDHTYYNFTRECLECHDQFVWKPSTFDHASDLTGFGIEGAHLDLLPDNCYACHETTQWTGLSSECFVCHESQFEATTDPDHSEHGFPENICETCHSQSAWEPSIFTHEATMLSCQTCHMIQYTNSTDPPHASMSFPVDCGYCHESDAWSPSSFAHNIENTGFDLDGSHLETSCASCHETWEPPTVIRTCASSSCHSENYLTTSNPPHETMGFSTDCQDCHSTTTWAPSRFQHDDANTGYPLEGAHSSVSCQSCHNPWLADSEIRTCADASCHLPDYNSTTDPNHSTDSFPLDCETCHGMDAWEPSTFDHDGQSFPIYSGQHRNEWSDCSQCHVDANDFGVFTCFGGGCHNVTEMNNEHCEDNECESCNGITYPQSGVTPEDCYTCHPTGDEDDCEGDLLNFFKLRALPQPIEKKPDETR